MLGIRTRGSRVIGTDDSTDLWRTLSYNRKFFFNYVLTCCKSLVLWKAKCRIKLVWYSPFHFKLLDESLSSLTIVDRSFSSSDRLVEVAHWAGRVSWIWVGICCVKTKSAKMHLWDHFKHSQTIYITTEYFILAFQVKI